MTHFNHQQRSGKHKRPKAKPAKTLGIGGDVQRLVAHRELQALRNPSAIRYRKLDAARRMGS